MQCTKNEKNFASSFHFFSQFFLFLLISVSSLFCCSAAFFASFGMHIHIFHIDLFSFTFNLLIVKWELKMQKRFFPALSRLFIVFLKKIIKFYSVLIKLRHERNQWDPMGFGNPISLEF